MSQILLPAVQSQIDGAVSRVNPEIVALPSVTLAGIFQVAFPLILGCISKWIEKPTPEKMQEVVAAEYAVNPKKVIRGAAKRIKRSSEERLTKAEALELGRAATLQMIEGDSAQVAEACRVIPPVFDEYDSID